MNRKKEERCPKYLAIFSTFVVKFPLNTRVPPGGLGGVTTQHIGPEAELAPAINRHRSLSTTELMAPPGVGKQSCRSGAAAMASCRECAAASARNPRLGPP